MEALIAIAIGLLTAGGLRLLAEGRSFPVLLGAVLLSHAVNLFLFSTGQIVRSLPPIAGRMIGASTDPLPQALVLTAIVISFGMTAIVAAMAVAARMEGGRTAWGTPLSPRSIPLPNAARGAAPGDVAPLVRGEDAHALRPVPNTAPEGPK